MCKNIEKFHLFVTRSTVLTKVSHLQQPLKLVQSFLHHFIEL